MSKTKKFIFIFTAIILLCVIIATSVFIGFRIGTKKTTEENTTEEASETEVIIEQEETATLAKEETTTVVETTTSRTITTKKETIYQNSYYPITTSPSVQREDEALIDPNKDYDIYFDGENYYYAERKTETSTQVIVIIGTSLVPIDPWQGEDNQQDIDGRVNSYKSEFN